MSSIQQGTELVRSAATRGIGPASSVVDRVQGEVVRKTLHLFIALVPVLASVNLPATFALLAAGTLFYVFAETSRLRGVPVVIVTAVTVIASREKDRDRFVLGPVTLSLGAMLALFLYPSPAATLGILALAFGDGLASLVGTLVRGPSLPLLRGKSIAGSTACFAAVFLVTLRVTGSPSAALVIAASTTLLEALPAGNFDNVVIPVGVGFVAWALGIG